MTQLDYLENSAIGESRAVLSAIDKDEKGDFLVFDKTIFYPQGGGQPNDLGIIEFDEKNLIEVKFVGYHLGDVRHYVTSHNLSRDDINRSAALRIDLDRRRRNSMLHSAGHLLSHVCEEAFPELYPVKGYHFPEGPYVEFQAATFIDSPSFVADINDAIRKAIEDKLHVSSRLASYEEVSNIRPILAPLIPKDKPIRIVKIGNFRPLPCGGTHVNSTSELAGMSVTKIKRQKDNLKISYNIFL